MKEEGYNYEEFHAKALEICMGYGLEHTERLDKWLNVITPKLKETLEERKAQVQDEKEWLDLADILRHGEKRVSIQASIPDEGKPNAMKHLDFPLSENTKKKLLRIMFDDELTEEDFQFAKWIASYNLRVIEFWKGRGKDIPFAGYLAYFMLGNCKNWIDDEAFFNQTSLMCLLGDLILLAGASPVEEKEWKEILTNKDKADKVKYWLHSYPRECSKFFENEAKLFCDEFISLCGDLDDLGEDFTPNNKARMKTKLEHQKKKGELLQNALLASGFTTQNEVAQIRGIVKDAIASGKLPSLL